MPSPKQLWALEAAMDAPADDGVFGYQLVHGDPAIDDFIRDSLALGNRPASYQNYIANPTPGLMFYATQSSTGYHVNGLPLENLAHINEHPDKLWTRYSHSGFLEINDALFAAICPADLNNRKCVLDETWCWDPDAGKWRGGCQMLRLCQQLHKHPRPAPPALTPFQYALHVPEVAHDALMKIQAGDPDVTSLFTAQNGSNADVCLPLLGTTKFQQWPVIVHAGCSPKHPAHAESCSLLHGIKATCLTLKPHPRTVEGRSQNRDPKRVKTEEHYHDRITSHHNANKCKYGHDFEEARLKSFHRYQEHIDMALDLARAGQVVMVQRMKAGVVTVWVATPGVTDQYDRKDKFIIDGDMKVRKTWDIPHTLGWCQGCNPAPEPHVWEWMMRFMANVEESAQDNAVFGDESVAGGGEQEAANATGETAEDETAEGTTRTENQESPESDTTVTCPWKDEVEEDLLKKWKSVLDH